MVIHIIEMRKYCYYIPSAIKHAILFQHLHLRINKVLDILSIVCFYYYT